MTPEQKETLVVALKSIIRAVLVGWGAVLTQHKLVDGPVLGMAIDTITAQIVGFLFVVAGIVWGQVSAYISAWRTRVALVMPPHATVEDLKVVTKATSPGSIPTPAKAAAIVATNGQP